MNLHTIYIVNQLREHCFWCFLCAPVNANALFLSSNLYQTIPVHQGTGTLICSFKLPNCYTIGAGVATVPLQEQAMLAPQLRQVVDPPQIWAANFAPAASHGMPQLHLQPTLHATSLHVRSNIFTKREETVYQWFTSLWYGCFYQGVSTSVVWSPDPNTVYELASPSGFYILRGTYAAPCLFPLEHVKQLGYFIQLFDFDAQGAVTVTLANDGQWLVRPGKP